MEKKKEYISPIVNIELLEADSNFAMTCGSGVGHRTVGCLQVDYYDDYEALVDIWGLPPDSSLDGAEVRDLAYSNDRECLASCYQGPFDTVFTS